jgi:hypothetical protein
VALREIEPVRITRDPAMLSVNMRAINGRKKLVRMTASPVRVERRIVYFRIWPAILSGGRDPS